MWTGYCSLASVERFRSSILFSFWASNSMPILFNRSHISVDRNPMSSQLAPWTRNDAIPLLRVFVTKLPQLPLLLLCPNSHLHIGNSAKQQRTATLSDKGNTHPRE